MALGFLQGWRWSVWGGVAVALLAACSSPMPGRAPVEDRLATVVPDRQAPGAPAPAAAPVRLPPGAENAGKPGYYTVKPGDTLIRIGLEHGTSYRELARWNQLENPNRIEVGQVLRVVPPQAEETVAVATPVGSPAVVVSPVTGAASGAVGAPVAGAGAAAGAAAPANPASAAVPMPSAAAPAAPVAAPRSEDEPAWIWPSAGPVIAGYDEVRNKGLDIGGSAGDPVLAAADGRVVYAGSGLRGYGNLVILKHNATFLTAYAHNQTLLVKEDQAVKRGQKIAEMGSTDADRVKLHFEVRRQGKPVDPSKHLPAR